MAIEDFSSDPAIVRANKFVARLIIYTVVGITIFGSLLYLDRPRYSGTSINGSIISFTGKPDGYRSLTAEVIANVELDNGDVIYKQVNNAHVGQRVTVRVYKRRITGITHYK